MYNEPVNACVSTEEVASTKTPINELLKKLDDLSEKNLDLATSIDDNIFGHKSNENGDPMPPIDCMENAIRSILEKAYKTNTLLTIIHDRL